MKRLICWIQGHDWYNRKWETGNGHGSAEFMRVVFHDHNTGDDHSGYMDLCFRCGKLKWRPDPSAAAPSWFIRSGPVYGEGETPAHGRIWESDTKLAERVGVEPTDR